jgi:ribosomal-protein-serine acetyltransferase
MEIISPFSADRSFKTISENREYLRRFLGWVDATKTKEDTFNFINGALKRYADKKEINYHIIRNQDIIETIGIWKSNEDTGTCEIGYWIAEYHSRKGIMSKCAKELMEIGFTYLEAKKIEICCAVENEGSNLIAKKLGMVLEGTIRNAENVNGKIYDHNIYGIIRNS